MHLYPLRVLLALTALLLLATASAGNAATVVSMRTLPGTQLPLVRHSARLATTAESTPVSVVLSLQPRNRALLAHAAASSHPMSDAKLRQTFAPSPGNVVALTRYMQAHGFRLTSSGLLSLSFSGDAGSARRAFGVGLSTYRAPSGRVFRAPDGPVKLPPGLAPLVQDVSGLDTALRLERHTTVVQPSVAVPTPTCGGPGTAKSRFPGSHLPADLADAYNYGGLTAPPNNGDGSGETIGLVEFTNYKASDIATYKSCFGLTNPVVAVPINGGPGSLYAAIEAELDIEVAISNAPGVDQLNVYEAPNNVSNINPILDHMLFDGVTVVSDSWGLCEPFLTPSFLEAESTHLQALAANGISFFSATGDSGSSDCAAVTRGAVKGLYADDPSSQPFATAVGGTTLHANGTSTTWVNRKPGHRSGGGGGVSQLWPQPSYQSANPTGGFDNGSKCGNVGGTCRQTPDVSLNANPNTGYIIFCTVTGSGCPPNVHWFPVGGTSASAPLMAAIAADANTYSRTQPGTHARMGFANPFLYGLAPSAFTDVVTGNNNIYSATGKYPAKVGYDLATGLGSPDAMALATALTTYTPSAVVQDASQIAITAPASDRTVVYGKSLTFSGTLLDSGNAPIAGRRVYLELKEGPYTYVYTAHTDVEGNWTKTLAKELRRNLTWSVNFPGSDTESPANAVGSHVFVIPHLGSAISASSARRGTAFTFRGTSVPNMHGVKLTLQGRRSTGAAWQNLTLVPVARNGSYAVRITVGTPGPVFLRWSYTGGVSKPWMPAVSPARRINIL